MKAARDVEVSIIGGGPAGLSAAIELAQHGVRSRIYDENPKLGGAVFRQIGRAAAAHPYLTEKSHLRGQAFLGALEPWREMISLELGCQVLGSSPFDGVLVAQKKGELLRVPTDPVVVSTGCHERAQPFPGWTLPGVMSVGGAQFQAKSGLVRPGAKLVLVGTGPLLLVAAKQLDLAGVEVVGVFESGRRAQLMTRLGALSSHLALLKEGFDYLRYLMTKKIPIHYGHGIVSASGQACVERVTLAPYGKNGSPMADRSVSLEVDCVAVGYGYVPRVELTRQLRCEHRFDDAHRTYVVTTDDWQRTTVPGIYAAGDNTGVLGWEVAELEGKLAALGVLFDLQVIPEEVAVARAAPHRKRGQRLRRFQDAFSEFSRPPRGLIDLPDAETLVCRCENVRRKRLDEALDRGVVDMTTLKMETRVGMGDCQGKMCGSFCAEYLGAKLGKPVSEVGALNPRFPLSPLKMSALGPKKVPA